MGARSTEWKILFGLFAILAAVFGLLRIFAPVRYVVEGQALVLRHERDAGRGKVVQSDDFLSTHMVLLRSPIIIQQAVGKRNLDQLETLREAPDPVKKIQEMLTVERSPTVPNIVVVQCKGPNSEDCRAIWQAVVESYQEFLEITYRDRTDEVIERLMNARKTLKSDLAVSEEKLRRSEEQMGELRDPAPDLRLIDAKILELDLRRGDVAADVLAVQANPKDLAIQLKIQQWSNQSGYRQLPDAAREQTTPHDAYHAAKKHDLTVIDARLAELRERQTAARSLIQKRDGIVREHADAAKEVERCRAVHELTVKWLQEVNLLANRNPIEARVLVAPAVRQSNPFQ